VQAGLVPSVVDKASSSVHQGDVISTNPPFGTKLAKNSTVKLFVSAGPASVKVPRVVGENENAASSQLQNAGFQVSEKSQPNSTEPQGQVVGDQGQPGHDLRLRRRYRGAVDHRRPGGHGAADPVGSRVQCGDQDRAGTGRVDAGERVQPDTEQRHDPDGIHGDHLRGGDTDSNADTHHAEPHGDRVTDPDRLVESRL
jgi:hypothetical protein